MRAARGAKILSGILIATALIVAIISIRHPIILAWLTGAARHHGRPLSAQIYTDGKPDEHLKLYYTDDENTYFMTAKSDSRKATGLLLLNLNEKSIHKARGEAGKDYDFIAGHLFETENSFTPLAVKQGSERLDPQFTIAGNQVEFRLPLSTTGFKQVKIVLPE